MQYKINRLKKKTALIIITAYMAFFNNVKVFAADEDVAEVTGGIDVLTTLVYSAIGGVGAIFLAWGLLDFGTAYSAHDSTQQAQAIKKVIGGLVIIAIPTIIGLLT